MIKVGIAAALLICLSSTALGQIEISGPLSGTLPAETYLVTGDLSIFEGDTLIIEPGTTLLFDGQYDFNVESNRTLICEGTALDSIRFLPNVDGGVVARGHLVFSNSGSEDVLAYCLISDGDAGGFEAGRGGGVFCVQSSSPSIIHCTINGNTANSGGGIACEDNSNPIIEFCTIRNNYAAYHGGGIYLNFSSADIHSCMIVNNRGELSGGGIHSNGYPSFPTISSSTIARNSTNLHGGAMHINQSSPEIVHCTIVGNSAGGRGGGVNCEYSDSLVINSTTITGNVGEGVFAFECQPLIILYSNLFANSEGDYTGWYVRPDFPYLEISTVNANGDPCDEWFNISLDPLYVEPDDYDYHLQAGSPCIDAGDPELNLDPDGTIAEIGAFYFDQTTIVDDLLEGHVFQEWNMLLAYPNPFNASTTVSVTLPATSDLSVTVYNVTGHRIAEIAQGQHSGGRHSFVFDATGLASGLYFIHTTVPGRLNQMQKVMLVK